MSIRHVSLLPTPFTLGLLLALLSSASAAQSTVCTFPMIQKNPDGAYQITSNHTVVDQRHNLEWDQCAWGQEGADCATGRPHSYNWDQLRGDLEAVNAANGSNYKSHDDWRMPTLNELLTLVESCRLQPAINTNAFPNTPSVWFWAWALGNIDADDAAGIYFYDGYSYAYGHRNNRGLGRIRLVRDSN